MLRVWCWIRGLRSRLWLGIEGWVSRWVTLERVRRQAVREGRPDPREMDAEITAVRWRVRELEKENECVGKPAPSSPPSPQHQRFELLNLQKASYSIAVMAQV